jgi:hypothetical protein
LTILEPAQSAPATTAVPPLSCKNEKAYSLIYFLLLKTVQNNLSHAVTETFSPDPLLLWIELKKAYNASSLQGFGNCMEIIWGTRIPGNEHSVEEVARMRSAYSEVIRLTLPPSSFCTSNLASPQTICLVLSRLTGPVVLLATMPLVLPWLDLPDLITTTATGTRLRTGTMVNVRVKDRARSNKVKVKAIKIRVGISSEV